MLGRIEDRRRPTEETTMRTRWMFLLAASLLAIAAAPPAPEKKLVRMGGAPRIPDSPEGRRAAAWLRAFNSSDADTMAAFYRANLAAAELRRIPLEQALHDNAPRPGP